MEHYNLEDKLNRLIDLTIERCKSVEPVAGRENTIGKALLVREDFRSYKGEAIASKHGIEKINQYLKMFFDMAMEESILGTLLSINYIQLHNENYYAQACKDVRLACQKIVLEKYEEALSTEEKLTAKDAMILFILLVFCEEG